MLKSKNKNRILITFPTNPKHPYLHKKVGMFSWRLAFDNRYSLFPIWPSHSPYENNLHHIVNDFIRGDYDYWLNIDSDNPPINNPLDLIQLNLDIIGLPTPVWHFKGNEKPGERPMYWNGYDYVPDKDAYKEHLPRKNLQRVDAIGTGCFIISKKVFQDPYMRKGPFQRKYYSDGTVQKGNDIAFSERARNQGFKLYVHYDYPCFHFNELELNEIVTAFTNLYKKE